ncbi:hypothetical protein [Leifsonia sp. Leaf264]|uniref:hypothetical protein n=1 Tax=Leifsonia sp. Leaf264 TaxID=1736314 RepID=UPI0007005B3C|nr:hypothetical protein [Leifsonia sp. Leaf264]KQO97022.1 hypothetical protein ASF30_18405 [Leifsonia sp. Leaf264]
MNASADSHHQLPLEPADALDVMTETLRWFETLDDLPSPTPGSQMDGDDVALRVDPLSYLVRHFDSAARENVVAVLKACHDAGLGGLDELPTMALYPQMRAAIETAAWGCWLLAGGTRVKRMNRALSVTYKDANDFGSAAAVFGVSWKASDIVDRLEEVRVENRLQRALSDPGSTTDMLIEVGRKFPNHEQQSPLGAWKLCSGMAHGSRGMMMDMSKTVDLGTVDSNGNPHMLFSLDIGPLALFGVVVERLLRMLRELYDDAST